MRCACASMKPPLRGRSDTAVESLYVLIPVTLLLVGIALAAWLWSVGSGQFEDLDKAARSILFDDAPAPRADEDASKQDDDDARTR